MWFNRRWYEFTGATTNEAVGWGWRSAHHPEHVARVVEGYRRALAAGKPWEDTFPLRGKDGRYRWFLSRAAPVQSTNGPIEHWLGTNTDVTEQIEITEKQRESEARFRALVEASPLGIVVMDMNGEPTFYNPKCEVLHG